MACTGKFKEGILLIHPPLTKAGEAPAGVARIAGALRISGVACRIWDANLEGQLALMEGVAKGASEGKDTWTYRASRHWQENLAAIRSWDAYLRPERYRQAVLGLNRLLKVAGDPVGVRLSLSDYEDHGLSPLRSSDLYLAERGLAANPFTEWFSCRLEEVLKESPFSHIGLSLNYLSQALCTFMMIGHLRRRYPERKIILGGSLVTSWMTSPSWQNPFRGLVSEVVSGPGEARLLTLFGKEIPEEQGRPSFDDLPLEDYLSPGVVLPYSTASGCWWGRCLFCPEAAEGRPYKALDPCRVREDLSLLTASLKPSLIHFLDNALSPAILADLADRPLGVPWYGFSRFVPALEDLSFCRRLRQSGCLMLQLGLESADKGVLEALGKGIDPEAARRILENLSLAGIATYVYLLFGTPPETRGAALRTHQFVRDNCRAIDYLNVAIFNLPAHGALTGGLKADDFYAGDLSLYRPFRHPQGWDRPIVRRFLEEEFKRTPEIARILRKDPPLFTSNHAPFFKAVSGRGRGLPDCRILPEPRP